MELLIVLVVLGVLFILGLFLFNDVRDASHNTAAQADARAALMKATSSYVKNQNSFGSTTAEAISQLELQDTEGLSYTSSSGPLASREVFVQLDDAGTGYSGPVGQQITLCSGSETGRVYCLRSNQEQVFPVSEGTHEAPILANSSTNIVYAMGPSVSDALCALPQPGSNLPMPWPPIGCEGIPSWSNITVEVMMQNSFGWGNGSPIGYGDSSNVLVPTATSTSGVLAGRNIDQVSAGNSHSCAISNGDAFCWGSGNNGELGDGNGTASTLPVAVDTSGVLENKDLSMISAGTSFTCAATDTEVFCWGRGLVGELGNGTFDSSNIPVSIDMSGVLSGKTITDLDAGSGHACVIADSEVFCWGDGGNGRLGNGSTGNSNIPVAANTSGVLSGKTMVQVSAGRHTCAIDGDGDAYCWGRGSSGQLGYGGSALTNSTPREVDMSGVLSGRSVSHISAGQNHTCAIADDEAFCWGIGNNGRLGNNGTSSFTVPDPVDNTGVLAGRSIDKISAGDSHSCAVANEEAYCWGAGGSGRLGEDDTVDRWVPVSVYMGGALDGRTVLDVDASGFGHTIALAIGS